MRQPSPVLEDLATAIRTLRDERGLTIEELADQASASAASIARIEHAELNPTWEKLCSIAAGLGVTPSDLTAAAEDMAARRVAGSDDAAHRL